MNLCADSSPVRSLPRDFPISGEDLAAAYARTRDPALRDQAIAAHRSLTEILAAKMTRPGAPTEDLTQVATIGLIQALDRFDPERGVKFVTYAVNTIVGEIRHYFRDCTRTIRIPRRLQEVAAAVHRANEAFASRTGRAPTVPELAEQLGLSEEQILEAMELEHVAIPYSLDAHLGTEDTEGHERLNDLLGREDRHLNGVVDYDGLRRALRALEPRKRWILRRRYYDEWSQSEVGRAMGISQMHVSRLEREALRELRQAMT